MQTLGRSWIEFLPAGRAALLGSAAVMALLAFGQPAAAQECLLDTSGDGNADTNVDTVSGASATGAFSTACGSGAVASGNFSTATGAGSTASATNSTATGSFSTAAAPNSTATGAGSTASGLASTATGDGSIASGTNSTATGAFSTASGDFSTATGVSSTASATNSTALGAGASAAHTNAMALGAGATTTRPNQVMVGTATNTYTLPGITSAVSAAAQAGPTQIVTSDAAGNLATDGGAIFSGIQGLQEDIRENRDGIALALAMQAPWVPLEQQFALSAGFGAYSGGEAFAASGAYRLDRNVQFDAGLGIGLEEGQVGGRVGVTVSW